MKKKLGFLLALVAIFQFSSLNAAPIDKELAILASEQSQNEQTKSEEKVDKPAPKSKQELEAEQKKLREEKREEEKRLKAEREAARKQIEEGKREKVTVDNEKSNRPSRVVRADNKPNTVQTSAEENSVAPPVENSTTQPAENSVAPPAENSTTKPTENSVAPPVENSTTQPEENSVAPNTEIVEELPLQNSEPFEVHVGMPNPIKSYSSFEEVSDAVGFTPLYIPKKSGYIINGIMSIDSRIAEIRYGRRWEPEVLLVVRTYKRAPGEELEDISGIEGAKWRVDESSGTTVYIAKISDNNHAAAWAVGDFTFAAYVENLSFAAFYALVVEELVDLSNHYYAV